jgi:hypothetical protein
MEIFCGDLFKIDRIFENTNSDNEERKKHIREHVVSELNKKTCLSVGRSLILMVSIK